MSRATRFSEAAKAAFPFRWFHALKTGAIVRRIPPEPIAALCHFAMANLQADRGHRPAQADRPLQLLARQFGGEASPVLADLKGDLSGLHCPAGRSER